MSVQRKGKTCIVSGPSGVGKSTVLHALFQGRDDLYFSVSATTRPPREGERDGVDYHFIQPDEFRDMIAADAFLEYAEYVGNFYGTPKMYVDDAMARGKDVILDIERQGAVQVCAKRPETVRIFIAPPSWPELERRLTARGTDTPEKVQKRDAAHAYTAIGVPAEWVEVIQKAGYLTVEALGAASTGKLHQDICGLNKKHKLGLKNPSQDEVAEWIANAANKE